MPDNDNIDNIDPVNADDNTNPVNTDPTPNPDDINTSDDIIIYNDTPIYDDVDPLFPKTIERERDRIKAEELRNKGDVLLDKKKYDEAKEAFLQALNYDDTYARSYNGLGVVYWYKLDHETAVKYFYKALKCDPLYKITVDNLDTTLKNNLKRPDDANKVLQNYNEALRNHINANTTKVTKIESLIDATKLKQHAKQTENTLKKIKDSESKITDIKKYIDKCHDDIKNKYLDLANDALAGHYQKKANDLREELHGVPKPESNDKSEETLNENPKPDSYNVCDDICSCENIFQSISSLGFIKKYWGMLALDIIVLIGVIFLPLSDSSTNFWEILAQHTVRISPIMILLLWGTRYFNRRIHETVHLIEEYEHKAIVLRSFAPYSVELASLDPSTEKTALLKYTEKVSHIITESPTHALTRKKTDKLPMEFVQALNQAHSKN